VQCAPLPIPDPGRGLAGTVEEKDSATVANSRQRIEKNISFQFGVLQFSPN
jgi:hypothetical protein